jgi:AcrR family transcriptional regulator
LSGSQVSATLLRMARQTQPAQKPGLRELKKQRTRQAILDAAYELFAEQGYGHTTLEQIAEAAEVSKGTLFAYFPSKEDILFPDRRWFYDELERQLKRRDDNQTTFDALREVLTNLDPPDERLRLRWKLLSDEGLPESRRSRPSPVNELLTASLASDLGTTPDDLRPILVASLVSAAMITVGEHIYPESGAAINYQDALILLEQIFAGLRTGLAPMTTTGG